MVAKIGARAESVGRVLSGMKAKGAPGSGKGACNGSGDGEGSGSVHGSGA